MDGSTVSQESFTTVNWPIAALTYPNTNIVHGKIVITPGTRAEFYQCTGSSCTKSCDINTNLPSGSSRLEGAGFQIVKSAGTTARTVDTDWTSFRGDLSSARSP
jgi:hypothetical protein